MWMLLLTLASASDRLDREREVEVTLEGGQVHGWPIKLGRGRTVRVEVEQDGVDAVVILLDPDGMPVKRADSRTGTGGIERLTWFTERRGTWIVQVRPFLADAEPGTLRVRLAADEPTPADPLERVAQVLEGWKRDDLPGFSWSVGLDEQRAEGGVGLANLEYAEPFTADTPVHAASVSKPFTASAVAMLVDEGMLAWTDDVRDHLPWVPDFGEPIRLEHLVGHTSGLRDQWQLLYLSGVRLDDVIRTDHITRLVARQEALNHRPGEEFSYTNTGYTLLAEIVASKTGETLDAWATEHLFEPAGMTGTFFFDDHERIVPRRAYAYRERDGSLHKSVLSFSTVGPSSLFTTARDLRTWCEQLSTSPLAATLREPAVLNDGTDVPYGRGLALQPFRGLATEGHMGLDQGFTSIVLRVPEANACVAVLSNTTAVAAPDVGLLLTEALLLDRLEPTEAIALDDPTRPDPVELDPAPLLGPWHSRELDTTWSIESGADGLELVHLRHGRFALRSIGELRFVAPELETEVFFEPNGDEITAMFLSNPRARNLRFERYGD